MQVIPFPIHKRLNRKRALGWCELWHGIPSHVFAAGCMPPILARDLVPGLALHQLSLVQQSRDAAVHEEIELASTHRTLACQAPGPAKQSQGPGRQDESPRRRPSLMVRIELWRHDSYSTSSTLYATSSASPLSAASRPSASAQHFPDYAPERHSSAPDVRNRGATIASLAPSSHLSQNSKPQHPKLARRSFVTTIKGFVRDLSAPKSTSLPRKQEQEYVSPFLQQSRPTRVRDLSFWGKRW